MTLHHSESHIEATFYEAVAPNLHYACQLIEQVDQVINDRITFRADFVLHNPTLPKDIIFECDGIEHHRGWEHEHYDMLRDAVLLLNGNCSHVIRFTGKGIKHYMELLMCRVNKVLNKQGIAFLNHNYNLREDLDLAPYLTIRDRAWLMDSGIMREAKWVIEESDCPFYQAHEVFLKVIEQNL